MDPTFGTQFSQAARADILRWAEREQLPLQAQPDDGRGKKWRMPMLPAHRLALMLFTHARRMSLTSTATELPKD